MTDRIEKTIDLNAPIDRVWRALTDHREFSAWFQVEIAQPFVLGEVARGRITFPGYEHVPWEVRVVAIDEPALFAFTWHPYALDPDVDYSQETPTRVEFRLQPSGAGTQLTVTESGFDAIPAGRVAEAFRMNERGWTTQVENIRAYVEG